MVPKSIRPIAICVFRKGTRILVGEGYDPVKQQTFYRPLGGAIEHGEHSAATIQREMREEIEADVTGLCYLGALENIFTFNGETGHEIVMVYDGRFVEESLYNREVIDGIEEHSEAFRAVWLDLATYSTASPPLYPDGLFELLTKGTRPA